MVWNRRQTERELVLLGVVRGPLSAKVHRARSGIPPSCLGRRNATATGAESHGSVLYRSLFHRADRRLEVPLSIVLVWRFHHRDRHDTGFDMSRIVGTTYSGIRVPAWGK
jgi:hypothetical protein